MTAIARPMARSGAPSWPWASWDTTPMRQLVVDAGLAVALAGGATLMDVVGPDGNPPAAGWWNLALAAPIVLRRARPGWAAALVGLVCLAQWWWWMPAFGDLAVLVVLFTLAAHGTDRRLLVLAVLTAELGVVMAVTRWTPGGGALLSGLMLTGTVTAAWVAGVYVRTHRAWTSALRERAETAERERDHLTRMAAASERARIARELHDVVAHSLSVMITLNDAAVAVGAPGQARDTVAQASDVGRQALGEMSRLLGVLRDEGSASGAEVSTAPQPSVADLAPLVASVRAAGPAVELAVTGDPAAVPPSMQLALYRIVQESLTNVLKHGRDVTRVRVDVRCGADLSVTVRDDGRPAPTRSQPATAPSLGLSGITERAELFGGTASAGPGPDGGWLVAVRVPLVSGQPVSGQPVS